MTSKYTLWNYSIFHYEDFLLMFLSVPYQAFRDMQNITDLVNNLCNGKDVFFFIGTDVNVVNNPEGDLNSNCLLFTQKDIAPILPIVSDIPDEHTYVKIMKSGRSIVQTRKTSQNMKDTIQELLKNKKIVKVIKLT